MSTLFFVECKDTIATGTTATADIKMYDSSIADYKSWKKIGSLSFNRSMVALAAVYDNAVIIIGLFNLEDGCTEVDTIANALSSSVTIMELGQAELLN